MASARTHLAKTASFTPTGGSLWNITDLVEADDGESGSPTDLVTDASAVVNGCFVDAIKGEIVITTKDLSHVINAGCFIGATGSLVIAAGLRTIGKGFVTSNTLSTTYANAQLRSIHKTAPVVGDSTLVLTFTGFDPAGTTVATKSVA